MALRSIAHPDDVYNAIVDAHKGLSDEEYCRRFIVAGTVERATYAKVVRQDQFEDVT